MLLGVPKSCLRQLKWMLFMWCVSLKEIMTYVKKYVNE